MSLDVYIIYKEPKKIKVKKGLNGVACGSNVAVYDCDQEVTDDYWSANVTHNMCNMARHIPVSYTINDEEYENDLYMLVWRPEEVGVGNVCNNTNVVAQALQSGISYMIKHREELLQYNPSNNWGSYDTFLPWLIEYWNKCLENPDCLIECSR